MSKKKAAPKGGKKTVKRHDTPVSVQKAIVLRALAAAGAKGCSTIQLRERFDIMHPSGRVKELRDDGHDIRKAERVEANAQGNHHRNAVYVLVKRAARAQAA